MTRDAAGLDPRILASVLDLVHDRHAQRLDVAVLAEHAGYSPFHFSRLFTAATRVTPGQYLAAVRVDTAKRLLMTRDEPVIDIAVAVGYESLSSFSRRFRAAVGVPPGALRTLTRTVEDAPPRPFAILGDEEAEVIVAPHLPGDVSDAAMLWLGWYARPVPIGLPAAGVYAPFEDVVRLRLHPGAPWLLGFAVEPGDSPHHHIAPARPVAAFHPAPVTTPQRIDLSFARSGEAGLPLLSALPSLCRADGEQHARAR